jgi:hypothetical protein
MKKNEINLKKEGFNLNANVYPAGYHYKEIMRLGRVFPTTKAQAAYFIQLGRYPDAYNMDDVELVERELNPYGFDGEYEYTKSKTMVRLVNLDDMCKALKLKYGL